MTMQSDRTLFVFLTGNTVAPVQAAHGDFPEHFQNAIASQWPGAWSTLDVRQAQQEYPSIDKIAGIIISGSPSSVTERTPWMLRLESFIQCVIAKEVPLLGVCFGHQLMATAMGGVVQRNTRGRCMGTRTVRLLHEDKLFEGLPPEFAVNLSHQDHVVSLPTSSSMSITHMAEAAHDRFQAIAYGPKARSVQFHPEFGKSIMKLYIEARQDILETEGHHAQKLHAGVQDTPAGAQILKNFIEHFVIARTHAK